MDRSGKGLPGIAVIKPRRDAKAYLVCIALVLLTFAVYCQVTGFSFVALDDPQYVSKNPIISEGLTAESIAWSFTPTYVVAAWQPAVWISYLIDYEMSDLDPGAFHLTNLILHAAAAALLFLVLNRMLGSIWRSAFVAAVFAIHPLHIESVAWVTERKDVLSGLFWILAMLAYAAYAAKPGWWRYVLVVLCFVLGLMSKPMVITLPFVLLLLDYWPLGRFESTGMRRLLIEKIPLFGLAAASSVMTYIVQSAGGAVNSSENLGYSVRLANAAFSTINYIWKAIWPTRLSVIYPHPGNSLPTWQVVASIIAIVALTAAAYATRKRRPYLLVGWLWYLITLAPVVGIVQFGVHGMADRFTYIPLIGISLMVAYGLPEVISESRRRGAYTTAVSVLAMLSVGAMAVSSHAQLGYWRNSVSLFGRAVEITSRNYVAEDCLANALDEVGESDQAAVHYRMALKMNPTYVNAHYNLGNLLLRQRRVDEAIHHYLAAIHYDPLHPFAYTNLGAICAERGKLGLAEKYLRQALKISPENDVAHDYLGVILARTGRVEESIKHFSEAVRIQPDNLAYWRNYDRAKAMQ